MAYQYYDCSVTKITDETEHVKRFYIQKPREIPFDFKAGQFVMLDLPIGSKVTNRSYSIASPPGPEESFELVISRNPVGVGTTYLFNEVKEGSVLKVSKTLGKFILPGSLDRDTCFLCTGTGIAPFRAQLYDIFNKGIPHKNLYMVFGNRWTKDILYREEFEKLAKSHPEFNFIPVLSRDNPEWTGRKGYVHPVYEEIFADRRPAYFYLCGWADMLKEARQRLEVMGYDRKDIRFESYD
jgi:phenol/toluene 2-monooxygenase (NADH) P5/A5